MVRGIGSMLGWGSSFTFSRNTFFDLDRPIFLAPMRSRSRGCGVSTPASLLGSETLAQLAGRSPDWTQSASRWDGAPSDLPCARRPGKVRHPGRRYG